MECVKVKDNLSAYIDDMLDTETSKNIEDHLHKCPLCSEDHRVLTSLKFELGNLEQIAAPEDFLEKVRERLARRSLIDKIKYFLFTDNRFPLTREVMALATTALLVFIVFNTLRPIIGNPEKAGVADESMSAFTQDKDAPTLAVDGKSPIQLILKLRKEYEKPLSSENVFFIDSGARRNDEDSRELGFGLEASLKKRGLQDDFFRKKIDSFNQEDQESSSSAQRKNNVVRDIDSAVSLSGGQVLSVEYEDETEDPRNILLSIPSENYGTFLEKLSHVGSLKTTPKLPDDVREVLIFQIRIDAP